MSKQAWVTLATNDSYSLGALVLAHSLRRVGSTYPAVILITPSVTDAMRERLRAVFIDVIVVDVLDSRDAAHLALLQRPELGITFTKIHCWSLTQFDKCVFLDADTLVVQNCDELFEREELSAAPDVGWPDCFNSGVFVYQPSQETFDALIKFAKERGSFDGGDQGLLNSYFSSWARADINKHLPFLYNVTSAAFYSYLPALKHFGQDLKIIHFIGAAKPWLQTYNWESHSVDSAGHLKDTLQLWWEIFVSSVHPQLDVNMTGVAGNLARVVPGAISSQRAAIDELTRRQGWEAGNIDYLGADSFDNIWAKISQTLNQAPKQPSPPKEVAPTPKEPTPPPKEPTSPSKQPSPPPKQPSPPKNQPTPMKEISPPKAPSPAKQPSPPKEAPAPSEPKVEEIPATVEAVLVESAPIESPKEMAPVKDVPAAVETSKPEAVVPAVETKKTEPVVPATPPVTPETASTTPVTETAPVIEGSAAPKVSNTPKVEASPSKSEATPKKALEPSGASPDSPPLANTPSKDEVSPQQAAKSEGERARKPAGKLQLSPPGAADPLPTPDSELEDAASLALSIIASELATPTVISPTPPAPLTPASPPPALQQKRLSVDEPLPATPPAGPVSLAQIGVKPKPSIAAQIESSITDKVETTTPPETPTATSEPDTPTEAPKKKVVKKSTKKEAAAAAGADAPVPPPRKKEKKPKDK